MAKMIVARDSDYRKGMNSLDDPKALQDGECVELINAFPGYPLRPRKGSVVRARYNSSRALSKSFYATIKTPLGDTKETVFFWRQSGNDALLSFVDLSNNNSPVRYDIFNDGVGGRRFDFFQIGDTVYTLISRRGASRSWNAELYAIEWLNDSLALRKIPQGMGNCNVTFGAHDIYRDPHVSASPDDDFLYGYSWTLVRRTDTAGQSTVYVPCDIETIEDVTTRSSALSGKWITDIRFTVTGYNSNFSDYGLTHVRVYRTRNLFQAYEQSAKTVKAKEFARGADRYFLMDIPIPLTGVHVMDDVTEEEHLGEMNQLMAFDYTMPPDKDVINALYAKDRLFLGTDKGSVYFSEIPGGDGGGDVGFAQEAKAKYALWFKPTKYRLDLDAEEGLPVTGLALLGDDLYLFKQNKVYSVAGGDPTSAPLRTISDNAGCPFPGAIAKCKVFGEEALFFLSGMGPMLITAGGNIRPFKEFKIKELWPGTGNEEIQKDSCSASFWNNTLWLFFEIRGYAKSYGYLSDGETNGAFEVRHPAIQHALGKLINTIDGRALSVCNSLDGVALVDFLGDEQYSDGVNPIEISLLSRKIYPGQRERVALELFRLTGYCQFTGDERPFIVEVRSNRRMASHDFYSDKAVFQSRYPESQEIVRRSIDFFPQADFIGEYFQYKITKGIPSNGGFDFYSAEIECIPRPQLDIESFVGGGPNMNTWG